MPATSKGLSVILVAIIAALILFVAVSAFFLLHKTKNSPAGNSSAINQAWVDQKLAEWKPLSTYPMSFGVFFGGISYGGISESSNTPEVLNATLNMLVDTGANYIRMDIGYASWLNGNVAAQQEITSTVNQVEADNRSLIIADASSESYRGFGNQLTWTQFKQAWVQRVTTLASLYHPAYYIIIKEPGWYVSMVSDATTNPSFRDPNDWLNLTKQLADAVLAVSPNTKVGVSVDAGGSLTNNPTFYDSYLVGVEKIPEISFIGFDIYTANAYVNTQNFLDAYGNGGKDVWIAETWSGTENVVLNSSRADLDAGWMTATYYFAQQIHATMMIPFFTNIFASYNLTESVTNPSQRISLLQQRTPVFYAFQNITRQN